MTASINPQEIENFARDSGRWWDETGPFAPLHRLNPVRLAYIRGQIGRHYSLDERGLTPFTGLKILDIGCGGGLVCEPLARLGGTVTGIDADAGAIDTAKTHAEGSGLVIEYMSAAAETLAETRREQYDIVLALEIAEHVDHVDNFVQNCVNLCKPGGLIIFSTLNRTPKSFVLGIVAAEYILRWVPRGTHSWKKFLKPSELARMIRHSGADIKNINGLYYNPFKRNFELSGKDIDVNYFITAKRPRAEK